jgi:putative transposon-encoded protein
MKIELTAYETREKTVSKNGTIYLPKEWIGKKVKILLIEPLNGD